MSSIQPTSSYSTLEHVPLKTLEGRARELCKQITRMMPIIVGNISDFNHGIDLKNEKLILLESNPTGKKSEIATDERKEYESHRSTYHETVSMVVTLGKVDALFQVYHPLSKEVITSLSWKQQSLLEQTERQEELNFFEQHRFFVQARNFVRENMETFALNAKGLAQLKEEAKQSVPSKSILGFNITSGDKDAIENCSIKYTNKLLVKEDQKKTKKEKSAETKLQTSILSNPYLTSRESLELLPSHDIQTSLETVSKRLYELSYQLKKELSFEIAHLPVDLSAIEDCEKAFEEADKVLSSVDKIERKIMLTPQQIDLIKYLAPMELPALEKIANSGVSEKIQNATALLKGIKQKCHNLIKQIENFKGQAEKSRSNSTSSGDSSSLEAEEEAKSE